MVDRRAVQLGDRRSKLGGKHHLSRSLFDDFQLCAHQLHHIVSHTASSYTVNEGVAFTASSVQKYTAFHRFVLQA